MFLIVRYWRDRKWITKKEIIEMIENSENEGKLKFVYTILIKYLKSKKQGD